MRRFILLAAASTLLLAALVVGEYLLLPPVLEPFGRAIYRIAFLVVLPARLFCIPVLGLAARSADAFYWIGIAAATPWLYHFAWRLLRRKRTGGEEEPVSVARRQFLVRGALGAAAIPTAGVGGYASLVAPQRLELRRYDLPIRDLPPEFDGLRLAHVSDTHYGPFVSLPFLEGVVEKVNALDADLVLLTGDYVHRTPRAIPEGIALLGRFRSRHGSLAVLGNHDHWEGAPAVREALGRAGVHLVENRSLYLTRGGLSDSPTGLCIGGVGDLWDGVVDPDAALSSVPPGIPRILLSHNPDVAEMIPEGMRVDLMCSGHTHGGQVIVPFVGAPFVPSRHGTKYLGGLCEGPSGPVLVSRGVGLAGLPLRLGVPPEISEITLRRATSTE